MTLSLLIDRATKVFKGGGDGEKERRPCKCNTYKNHLSAKLSNNGR